MQIPRTSPKFKTLTAVEAEKLFPSLDTDAVDVVSVMGGEIEVKDGDLLFYSVDTDGENRRLVRAIARGHWHEVVLG